MKTQVIASTLHSSQQSIPKIKENKSNSVHKKQTPQRREESVDSRYNSSYMHTTAQYIPLRRLTYTLTGAVVAGSLTALYMYPRIPRDEFPHDRERAQLCRDLFMHSASMFSAGLIGSYLVPYIATKLDSWSTNDDAAQIR